MLKDLILSMKTPFTLGRSASKSSLSIFSVISDEEETVQKDSMMLRSSASRRTTPKRRLSIGDSIPKRLRRKKSNSLSETTESLQTLRKCSKSTSSLVKSDPINILVVGARNVGKSALTVRFITKRYIGEYMSGENQTYTYQATDDKKQQQSAVFLDESNDLEGEDYLKSQLTEGNLAWADGIMLVYDVGDIETFNYAKNVIDSMTKKVTSEYHKKSNKKILPSFKPLLLIGNKTDLVKRRSISEDDIKRAAEEFPAWVSCDEMSAAEGYDDVAKRVNELIIKARERKRLMSGLSTKDNIKSMVGSVLRHKSFKVKSRSV